MTFTLTGDVCVLKSKIKVADIELLKKYNPDALKIVDDKGNVLFAIGYSEGHPSIAPFGVTFGGKSRGEEEGYATVTEKVPSSLNTAEAKAYVADQYGCIIANVEKLEATVAEAATAVTTARQKIIDGITVA